MFSKDFLTTHDVDSNYILKMLIRGISITNIRIQIMTELQSYDTLTAYADPVPGSEGRIGNGPSRDLSAYTI
jgi:hypothetical protein